MDEEIYQNVHPKGDHKAAQRSRFHPLLVCLWILCGLLVVSIIILIIYNRMEINKKEENLEKLSRERDLLKMMLEVYLKADNITLQDFSLNKTCQLCQKNWIRYQEKCYLFYNKPGPWKTWNQSRKFCQEKSADLVVIDDLQEQKFIMSYIKYYYDEYHGYWVGLYKRNNTWVWIDGREDIFGFWIKESLQYPNPFALMIPEKNPTESWIPVRSAFMNRFICEANVSATFTYS